MMSEIGWQTKHFSTKHCRFLEILMNECFLCPDWPCENFSSCTLISRQRLCDQLRAPTWRRCLLVCFPICFTSMLPDYDSLWGLGERSSPLGGPISSCGGIQLCPQHLSAVIGVSILLEVCWTILLEPHIEKRPPEPSRTPATKQEKRRRTVHAYTQTTPWPLLFFTSQLPCTSLILAG